ncbi:MAG: NADH:flavin oxidoreductase/NADH oxidase family protein [Xanthomonadaceae bacterium]|nr:NADH:flavin oxidoreductase/NADH oxidase family protein [Xanthomonadaceae bacterium]
MATSPAPTIATPLRLPCGAVLPNRLCKSAMTEGVGDAWHRATPRHETLYRRWREGGVGLSITGNVMIDRTVLERPGNVAIDPTDPRTTDAAARARLARWARAGTGEGAHLWMQVSHAGRQSPRYVTARTVGPSAVGLELMGNYARPRALDEPAIRDFISRFGHAAAIARDCGFTGVQVHAAHGYLVSAFLSPVTNRRDDGWGGTLQNRARFLIEAVRATRAAVGADFPVSVKLNSDDFRKGGFSHADCLEVVRLLGAESVDLLEISGGTYEQPRLLGHEGIAESAMPVRKSTRAREAYFIEYADAIRRVATVPLLLTGGFRSRQAMDAALAEGACDAVGLGRPLVTEPDLPLRLLDGRSRAAHAHERDLVFARRGWRSPTSRWLPMRVANVLGAQGWYYQQILRLADGRDPDPALGLAPAIVAYLAEELRGAWRRRRAWSRPAPA